MKCLESEGAPWLALFGWSDRHVRELRSLGYSYLQQGRFDRAEGFFEALVEICPEEAYDSQALGALYLQNGKLEKAIERLEHAIMLDPHHLPTLLNKAKVLLALGRKEEGLELARSLEGAADDSIAGPAGALILGHAQPSAISNNSVGKKSSDHE